MVTVTSDTRPNMSQFSMPVNQVVRNFANYVEANCGMTLSPKVQAALNHLITNERRVSIWYMRSGNMPPTEAG